MTRRLLLLNGLAALGAVLNHSIGWGFTAMFWWAHRYLPVESPDFQQLGNLTYFALLLLQQLIMFAVPAFLFVSGFFIAFATRQREATVSRKMVAARVSSLLVPYLLWSLLFFGLDFAEGEVYGPFGYLELLITGRTSPPYYFVPLLIQLYLLSPLLVLLARRYPRALFVVAVLIQLAVRSLIYLDTLAVPMGALAPVANLVLPSWFFPGHLFWFVAGIIMRFHLDRVKVFLTRTRLLWLLVALILLPLGVWEWHLVVEQTGGVWLAIRETPLDSLYAMAAILAFLGFSERSIPAKNELEDLGAKSFGVYLVHSPVLEYTARIFYFAAPALLAQQLVLVVILTVVGVLMPLLLMSAVSFERSPVRRSYHYIFG